MSVYRRVTLMCGHAWNEHAPDGMAGADAVTLTSVDHAGAPCTFGPAVPGRVCTVDAPHSDHVTGWAGRNPIVAIADVTELDR